MFAVIMNPYTDQRYGSFGVYSAQADDATGVNAIY
jgi:hypothetical protein